MSQIATIVRQLSGAGTHYLKACEVTSVDQTARTVDCQPLDESAPLLACNLQGDQEGTDGMTLFPKVGSFVIVGLVDGADTGAVLLADELDAIDIKIGDQSLKITPDSFIFNGGKLGGLVNIDGLTDRLNAIESDINSLKQALSRWSPVPNDGGAALKGAIASWSSTRLRASKPSDYEDANVKH